MDIMSDHSSHSEHIATEQAITMEITTDMNV